MKNLFKSKKIHSFLLTMVMIVSLFFFCGCADIEDEEGLMYKIVYRPYASKPVPNHEDKTYKDLILNNLNKLSTDILTRLVGEYGRGEITLGEGEDEEILSPKLEENYYEDLLDAYSLNKDDLNLVVSKIRQTTNVYYIKNALVLSNYSVSSINSMIDIIEDEEFNSSFIANTNLTSISDFSNVSAGENLTENKGYLYESGSTYSIIFIGDSIGSNSISDSYNAGIFVGKLLTSNLNNIQQTVKTVNVVENSDVKIEASKWNYSLDDYDAEGLNATEFLNAYLEKFTKAFEVEIAKSLLTKGNCRLNESLNLLYEKAGKLNSTENEKDEFLNEAGEYIDHLGLLQDDLISIKNTILNVVIGELNGGFSQILSENCASILEKSLEKNMAFPLLEINIVNDVAIGDLTIDGYIQSIVILTNSNYNFYGIAGDFASQSEQLKMCTFTVRHCEEGVLTEYPVEVKEEDFINKTIDFDMSNVISEGKLKISKSDDFIQASDPTKPVSLLNSLPLLNMFSYSTLQNGTGGFCWCFNNLNFNFIEITFGQNDLCTNQQLDIEILFT